MTENEADELFEKLRKEIGAAWEATAAEILEQHGVRAPYEPNLWINNRDKAMWDDMVGGAIAWMGNIKIDG